MKKAFSKNEHVVRISDWDGKGTYYYRRCIVHACGNKRMTLVDANSGEMMGRNYLPQPVGIGVVDHPLYNGKVTVDADTFKDMTDEEAEALCLKFAAEHLDRRRAFCDRMINDESKSIHYRRAMQKTLDDLHEPRALNWLDTKYAK